MDSGTQDSGEGRKDRRHAQETDKAPDRKGWILSGIFAAAAGIVLFAIVVVPIWRGIDKACLDAEQRSSRPLAHNEIRLPDGPILTVERSLTDAGAQFSNWEKGLVFYRGIIRILPGGKRLRESDIQVFAEGPRGLKLKDGHVRFANVSPGESAQFTLHSDGRIEDVSRFTITLK